jgi:hypothetical protein
MFVLSPRGRGGKRRADLLRVKILKLPHCRRSGPIGTRCARATGFRQPMCQSNQGWRRSRQRADRPGSARAHSRQRWPSEPLASLHWPSRENLRSRRLSSSFEIILYPETQLHYRLVILGHSQQYGDILDSRCPRVACTECHRRNRIACYDVGPSLVSQEQRKKVHVRHKAITWRRAAEGKPAQQTSPGGSEPGADRVAHGRFREMERPNRAFPSLSQRDDEHAERLPNGSKG